MKYNEFICYHDHGYVHKYNCCTGTANTRGLYLGSTRPKYTSIYFILKLLISIIIFLLLIACTAKNNNVIITILLSKVPDVINARNLYYYYIAD